MKMAELRICENAKRKGQQAFYDGKKLRDNPYKDNSYGHPAWAQGFDRSKRYSEAITEHVKNLIDAI